MVGAPEAVLRAGPLRAVQWVFVTVVTAIVVAIAEPIGLNANIGFLALEMVGRTGSVHGTTLVRFVTSGVVFAVVDSVTDLRLWYATLVRASELTSSARSIDAAFLVAAILTIVFVITLPRFEDAAAVIATELVGTTRVVGYRNTTNFIEFFFLILFMNQHFEKLKKLTAVVRIFIRTIAAVAVAVAGPHFRYALAVAAGKFARVTGNILRYAHAVLVD